MKKAPLIAPDFNLNGRFHVCNTPKGYMASLWEHKQGNTICAHRILVTARWYSQKEARALIWSPSPSNSYQGDTSGTWSGCQQGIQSLCCKTSCIYPITSKAIVWETGFQSAWTRVLTEITPFRTFPLELLAHPGQVRAIKNKSDYLEHIGPRDNQELSMAEWAQPSLT